MDIIKKTLFLLAFIPFMTACKGQKETKTSLMERTCFKAFNFISDNNIDSFNLLFPNDVKNQVSQNLFDSALGNKIEFANQYLSKFHLPKKGSYKIDSISKNGVNEFSMGYAIPHDKGDSNAVVFIIFNFTDKYGPNKLTGFSIFPNEMGKVNKSSHTGTYNGNLKSFFLGNPINSITEFGFFGSKASVNNIWEGKQFGFGNNIGGNPSDDIKKMGLTDFFKKLFQLLSDPAISDSNSNEDFLQNKGQAATLKIELQLLNNKDDSNTVVLTIKDLIKEQSEIKEPDYGFIIVNIDCRQTYYLDKKNNKQLDDLLQEFYLRQKSND